MAGPDLTAADIVAYPSLRLLLRASRRPDKQLHWSWGLMTSRHRFRGIAAWMQTGRAAARLREDLSAALAAGITLTDERANKIGIVRRPTRRFKCRHSSNQHRM
jgi:hypothetical protein